MGLVSMASQAWIFWIVRVNCPVGPMERVKPLVKATLTEAGPAHDNGFA